MNIFTNIALFILVFCIFMQYCLVTARFKSLFKAPLQLSSKPLSNSPRRGEGEICRAIGFFTFHFSLFTFHFLSFPS